ncbi:MAG: DNA-binding protein [Candidatus Melainabacteria bacterium]|nr:DNA-binding protein [Candidatus Melainabacteria bacterium]
MTNTDTILVKRLKPGQELFSEIDALIAENDIKAGVILCLVGSLTKVNLRYANNEESTTLSGHFEIVSQTGVVSSAGSHIHLAVADNKGTTYGGHLVPGSFVYTTVEMVVMKLPDWDFQRIPCNLSGYEELSPVKLSTAK